jgi:S1-C subfamily serine protease
VRPALLIPLLLTCAAPALAQTPTLPPATPAAPAPANAQGPDPIASARAALDADDFLRRLNQSVRLIAQAVEPSVVHVAVGAPRRREVADAADAPSAAGGLMRMGQGSGWVYDALGHVVTNAHVVEDAPRIIVQLHDGRQVRASVVGTDAATDIAVIRLDEVESLTPARRATGEDVQQGDRVYAFGSPFGFKFSMTEGIVSGLARDPGSTDGYTNFIQSDAAVNPGHSGGPLVDIRGRVVGMNVAIATGTNPEGGAFGQSAGIAFAIPLATIEPVVEQLIATGSVRRGFLGINLPETDESNAARLEAHAFRGQGVAIAGVVERGPAAGAGLSVGDVVQAIRGQPVANTAQLRAMIAFTPPGQAVPLRVWRAGEVREVTVTLADLDQSRAELAREQLTRFGILGFTDAPASPPGEGAAITAVRRGSPAEQAGFTPGLRIRRINGVEVRGGLLATLADTGFPERSAFCTVTDQTGTELELVIRLQP